MLKNSAMTSLDLSENSDVEIESEFIDLTQTSGDEEDEVNNNNNQLVQFHEAPPTPPPTKRQKKE